MALLFSFRLLQIVIVQFNDDPLLRICGVFKPFSWGLLPLLRKSSSQESILVYQLSSDNL